MLKTTEGVLHLGGLLYGVSLALLSLQIRPLADANNIMRPIARKGRGDNAENVLADDYHFQNYAPSPKLHRIKILPPNAAPVTHAPEHAAFFPQM